MPDRSWKLISSQQLSAHRIFTLHADRYRLEPEGRENDFFKLEAPDWINIIPITLERQVVLVRQFRHGVRDVTLEIPGGMVDPGESPHDAAVRELLEETGYAAANVRELGWVWPNPAIQTNRCYTYLGTGAVSSAEARPDPYERIEVTLCPLREIPRMIREGEIRHALVVSAFASLFADDHVDTFRPFND